MLRVSFLAIIAFLCLVAAAGAAGPWDRLLAPEGRCGAQTDRSASPRTQERAMRCMVSFARRAEGRRALRVRGGRLTNAADRKAADILRCGEFSHTACGRAFTFHMRATAYATGCYGAGENIAWGSGR